MIPRERVRRYRVFVPWARGLAWGSTRSVTAPSLAAAQVKALGRYGVGVGEVRYVSCDGRARVRHG